MWRILYGIFSGADYFKIFFVCDNVLVLKSYPSKWSCWLWVKFAFLFYTLLYMTVKDRSVFNSLIHSNINYLFLVPFCGNSDRCHSYLLFYCYYFFFFFNNFRKTSERYKIIAKNLFNSTLQSNLDRGCMFSLFHITFLRLVFKGVRKWHKNLVFPGKCRKKIYSTLNFTINLRKFVFLENYNRDIGIKNENDGFSFLKKNKNYRKKHFHYTPKRSLKFLILKYRGENIRKTLDPCPFFSGQKYKQFQGLHM